jgi:PAS domain S-box-containing protein
MKIHKQLLVLVGLCLMLIAAITFLSVRSITASFSLTASQIELISKKSEKLWIIERQIDEMAHAVRNYALAGDRAQVRSYEKAEATLTEAMLSISSRGVTEDESLIIANLYANLERMKKKADEIFFLKAPFDGQTTQAPVLLTELIRLQTLMGRDLWHYQEKNAAETGRVLGQLPRNSMRVNLFFFAVLLVSSILLVVFVVYFRKKVIVPLSQLWKGTEEISRGNLEYRMQVPGEGDIARLAGRFNDMSRQLRASYAELEQKLYDRTRELASIDAVAFTLSHAGSLKDMLDKTLLRILDSLSGIDAKGGVFLCEPGGETMRLMAQNGLSPEFVQRESEIRRGECLCGMVAQSGELLFQQGCDDQRHTRESGEGNHSHIIIPIKSRGIVLGVIFLYPQRGFMLKPSDIQMLDAIGAQLGMAVENFRFYAEVKESSEKYWDLFENATDILFTIDASARLTAVNKAAEDFSGYSRIELFGKSVFDFLTPDGAEAVRNMFDAGSSGRQWTEFEVIKRDGSRAFIEVSVRRLFKQQQSAGYQVSARDVTEQKRLREALVQAERLGAIGQVGIAVRHEINNPLTTVIGNIELLIERYENRDSELTARLETVLHNALRIAEIVKQLQAIRNDKVVEYLKGVKMTDLKQK